MLSSSPFGKVSLSAWMPVCVWGPTSALSRPPYLSFGDPVDLIYLGEFLVFAFILLPQLESLKQHQQFPKSDGIGGLSSPSKNLTNIEFPFSNSNFGCWVNDCLKFMGEFHKLIEIMDKNQQGYYNGGRAVIYKMSSEVTAMSSTSSQLVPKADHLPRGLVMRRVIVH